MMIRRAFSGTEAAENCEVLKRGSLHFFAEDPGRQLWQYQAEVAQEGARVPGYGDDKKQEPDKEMKMLDQPSRETDHPIN